MEWKSMWIKKTTEKKNFFGNLKRHFKQKIAKKKQIKIDGNDSFILHNKRWNIPGRIVSENGGGGKLCWI